MKKTIADYIESLMVSGKPLTDAQAQQVAYWEFVDFQQGDAENVECNEAVNKLLKGIRI